MKYIEELFNDNERMNLEPDQENDFLSGPSITKEEICKAIKQSKNNKAVGPDDLPAEVIKLIDEDNLTLLEIMFNKIYNKGIYPRDWLKSTFIPIPKKKNAKTCNEYSLISLMSHALKIFLKILHNRIYKRCEANIKDTQFGFRGGMGTREALFGIRVLVQNCRDVHKDVFLCFVDYEKAFDKVQHEKLISILRKTDLDERDIRCIQNLYWQQKADVRTNGYTTDDVEIRRGVRQGCILSPLLFNLYSEAVFDEAMEDGDAGIKVNGTRINNIRYADDSVLLADSLEDLQKMMNHLNRASIKYGLKINTAKTKFMVVSRRKTPYENARLIIDGTPLERVTKYKYLGSWLDDDWDNDREIRCRIEIARNHFFKFKSVLTSRDLSLRLRMRYARCYVWSVLLYLLYGVETWTLNTKTINKLEAFEMWTYRRILKVPWTERVSNEEILSRMSKDREMLYTIKRRKVDYFGHLMRNPKYQLLQLIIEGKIEGKRGVGRKQMPWLRNIREWTGLRGIGDLLHVAADREAYKNVVANIQQ